MLLCPKDANAHILTNSEFIYSIKKKEYSISKQGLIKVFEFPDNAKIYCWTHISAPHKSRIGIYLVDPGNHQLTNVLRLPTSAPPKFNFRYQRNKNEILRKGDFACTANASFASFVNFGSLFVCFHLIRMEIITADRFCNEVNIKAFFPPYIILTATPPFSGRSA